MNKIQDDVLSYWEMCEAEGRRPLQRGMNYRWNPQYSVILMSQRSNAPYKDKIYDDGITIEYEGHDVAKHGHIHDPKSEDQVASLPSGRLTQNGLFAKAVEEYQLKNRKPELVKVYEKIMDGVWSLKGIFELTDLKKIHDGKRTVFRFILKLTNIDAVGNVRIQNIELSKTRIIPSEVKKEVYKRDGGKCVICSETTNLHFDHDFPYSKGGTSLSAKNVRLLCMRHNLEKSAKIQ